MKIVSWNCWLGFYGAKYEAIVSAFSDTDIFVIQECRLTDFDFFKSLWNHKGWYGDSAESDLGIAIFSKTWKVEFTNEFTNEFNRKFRYVVPFRISQNNKSFNLFAVWTKSGDYGLYAYDKNVISAAKAPEYQKLFNEGAVLIGDFNTFAKNDSGLQGLEEKLFPLINCSKNTRFWKTFTYCHGKNNLGIDDFCFSSDSLMQKICDIKFSVYDEWTIDPKNNVKRWRGFSDHCPISVEFEI